MKENIVKSFIVSSADWEMEVDEMNAQSAAISAVIFNYSKNKNNFMMSTTIMVNSKDGDINNHLDDAEFFATDLIFSMIGLDKISKEFKKFIKTSNEIKHFK